MKTHIVDVFAEAALEGNQLAVVLDASALSGEQMQAIAAETNFSETTFVTEHNNSSAKVRIFTPTAELPFAGHPTLGTAWVLTQLAAQNNSQRDNISLELGVGEVPVSIDATTGIAWLQSPTAEFSNGISPDSAAQLLGLNSSDISSEFPIRCAALGPSFQIIAVNDLEALGRCRVNTEHFSNFLDNHRQQSANRVPGLFVFTPHGHTQGADYAARMFFDANGPREDPATGSANCCFAAYLQAERQNTFTAIVDQGVEMGRPSKIYLHASDIIKVGGKVQHVFEGRLV